MYEILEPSEKGRQWYVVPKYVSGECWGADTKEQAEQILKFVKDRDVKQIMITNIKRATK